MPKADADLVAELGKLGRDDPESARLLGVVMALAGEVFVLKAQVERLRRALESAGAVDAARLEAAGSAPAMHAWLAAEERAFADTLAAPFLQPDGTINATRWMREE